jgi:DNA-binding CsgD family transcriptional regulator
VMEKHIKSLFQKKINNIVDYNIQIENDFLKICSPLIKNYPINKIIYKRIFKNGNYFLISNDLKIVNIFANYMKDNDNSFFENLKPIQKGEIQKSIWILDSESSLNGLKLLQSLGIYHGLNVVTRRNDDESIEKFIFATSCQNIEIYNFYINNFDILNRFIYYFKIKYSEIIENPIIKKLSYSKFYESEMKRIESNKINHLNYTTTSTSPLINFLKETKLQSYPVITTTGEEIFLSERQTECLYHLTNGKTAKEIAKCLGISYRTVQTHLNIVNEKVGSYSKSSAIKCLSENIKKFLELSYKNEETFSLVGNRNL